MTPEIAIETSRGLIPRRVKGKRTKKIIAMVRVRLINDLKPFFPPMATRVKP